jgi:hypothetical protein
MIKGWRNNPQWVQHYERKTTEKIQRQIDRMRTNMNIDRAMMAIDVSLRRNKMLVEGVQ